MPPPSNSNHPDVDEVRRRADECARHVYPDVWPGVQRAYGSRISECFEIAAMSTFLRFRGPSGREALSSIS